jgi:D-alanyl-D-alanine dipeptidase
MTTFSAERSMVTRQNICYLSEAAAEALAKSNKAFRAKGYRVKVFDCTRPQRAVDDFVEWIDEPQVGEFKDLYYPHFSKKQLFQKGYIATKSGHSRGSTVDLTIVKLLLGDGTETVDMGTRFDYFGPASHTESELIGNKQRANRLLLREVMAEAGFKNYSKEWWHYTLKNEPYKKSYFDFVIK